MKFRTTLLAGLMATAGCTTMSGTRTGEPNPAPPPTGRTAHMVGGLITGSIGEGLGSGERKKALEAEYRALEYTPSDQTVSWTGDRAGRSGDVVPAQPYRVGSQDCRQYTHRIVIDGTSRSARGTACRNVDGSWATLS